MQSPEEGQESRGRQLKGFLPGKPLRAQAVSHLFLHLLSHTGPHVQMEHNMYLLGEWTEGPVDGWTDGWKENKLQRGKVLLPQKPPRSTGAERQAPGSSVALGPR